MGKQGRQSWSSETTPPWKGGKGGADTSHSSSTWSYWQGSWKAKKDTAGKEKPPTFPVYSQTPLSTSASVAETAYVTPDNESESVGNYMKGLQKALSACRKADAKLRRLQELKDTREQQWSQYQKDLKTSFLAQKKQFQKDMDTLHLDLKKAMEASQTAVMNVQTFAQGKPQNDVAMVLQNPEDIQEADDAWNVLMNADTTSPSSMPQSPDAVLARALQEAHELARTTQALQSMQIQSGTPQLRRALVTPKRGTTAGAPRTVIRPGPSHPQREPSEEKRPAPEMLQKLQCNLQQLQQLEPGAEPPTASADPYLSASPAGPSVSVTRTPPHRSPGSKPRLVPACPLQTFCRKSGTS